MNGAHILFIEIELHIPYAHSLKQKRQPVSSLKKKLQNKFNASIAEIDGLEEWQRTVLGVVMVSNDKIYLEQQASKIEKILIEEVDMELLKYSKVFV